MKTTFLLLLMLLPYFAQAGVRIDLADYLPFLFHA